mmetsp:Transcript_23359/g.21249  ORF Transcript_23359/g.21249 Transcript_23359/m.21249 type:complete len:101 (-) Transcript_23359:33-335(-)
MNATDINDPNATGITPDNGALLALNTPRQSKICNPIYVNRKCKNDKKTIKSNPSTSVIYLFIMTIPTTEDILPITPHITTILLLIAIYNNITNNKLIFSL